MKTNKMTPYFVVTITLLAALTVMGQKALAMPVVEQVWAVSSTGPTGSGCDATAPHGLWTRSKYASPPACANYFDILAGTTLTQYDDGTALLAGSALNPGGVTATINIWFGGRNMTADGDEKNPFGVDSSLWTYYDDALNDDTYTSNIAFDMGGGEFLIDIAGMPDFQIGLAANDKTFTEDGASAWVNAICIADSGCDRAWVGGHHWDLNLDLHRVPEPATLALLGLGLIGMGARRRASRT